MSLLLLDSPSYHEERVSEMERRKQERELPDLSAHALLAARCRGRGREGVIHKEDLSEGGSASLTSSGSPPPTKMKGGSPLREREGESHQI
jgi:hypothetical protein